MSDFQAIADRVEIEALRGEFTDVAMMCDYDRVASLFTPDGALRMPNVPVELVGREQIRAWRERREAFVEYFVQTAHPGHDPARRRHRVRPCLPPRAHRPARRRLTPELRHLPRPLPAHRRRMEVR
jgi:SnoaL-like domain